MASASARLCALCCPHSCNFVLEPNHSSLNTPLRITVSERAALPLILGERDETRRRLEKELGVSITLRDDTFEVAADDDEKARRAVEVLRQLTALAQSSLRGGRDWNPEAVRHLIAQAKNGSAPEAENAVAQTARALGQTILVSERGKPIGPRTAGQKTYFDALQRADLTFCIGPAGTGKTYMSVAAAVAALKAKQVGRIILTRPAVEAGERLGFLPGDLEAKIDPYLRPLYDALFDMIETEKAQKMFERRTIEIAPLAYMRGRTLNDSFIILDEAQNTTPAQMKMFLTRLGFGSKMVVTGDVTQTDLPAGQESGLRVATRLLNGVPGIEIVRLGKADVVRHSLVQRIIEAYERGE
jgi:phosphate starvation-inducible protein PhoH and related proteins